MVPHHVEVICLALLLHQVCDPGFQKTLPTRVSFQSLESATRLPGLVRRVKVAQSCLTLCDPMDYTVLGIVQARILEWVAVPLSRGFSQPDLRLGIEPRSPTLQADSLSAELQVKLGLVLLLMRMRHIFLILSFYWCLISI